MGDVLFYRLIAIGLFLGLLLLIRLLAATAQFVQIKLVLPSGGLRFAEVILLVAEHSIIIQKHFI